MPKFSFFPYTRQRSKGGVFSFRFDLPRDVHARLVEIGAVGVTRAIVFSLRTRDPLVARGRAFRAAADVGDLVTAIRGGERIEEWRIDPIRYQTDVVPASVKTVDVAQPRRPARSRKATARTTAEAKAKAKASKLTLKRVFEEVYLPRRRERKGAVPRRRSRLDQEKAIARFVAFAGDKDVREITRDDAETFVRSLDVGSVATLKKIIICLSTISNAAVAADLIPKNPFRSLGPDRATIVADRKSYRRFDLDQLARFFDRTEREDGAVLWLPRLLLLTGARLEEMAQLRASWFVRRDGIEVIDLHEARVKSSHNRRLIPLHRDLLNLGVLDLVRRSEDRLFPELRYRASAERWSGSISTRLNREIDSALGTDRRLTVHSLRKTFEHACYTTGIPKPTINAITGHKPSDISEEHYLQLKDDVPLLKEHIDRVSFPCLTSRLSR